MSFSEEFRRRELVQGLAGRIRDWCASLGGPLTFMEVCGTHTMAIYQHGLRSLLPSGIRLISGPGCPVCVTPIGFVDQAVAYARQPQLIVASFGDMLRVPGSSSSLIQERARGADVRIVQSSMDAVALAQRYPDKQVVFLGVGFETTAPTVAASILSADRQGLKNYFVLAAHKTIPMAMQVLSADPELAIDGYLCPAHVSTVIGGDAYLFLAEEHGLPCVVTGFEPADIMQGVAMLVQQRVEGRRAVEIQYRRFVTPEGNPKARELLDEVFIPVDSNWRGIGAIPLSGLAIAEKYASFDAERALPVEVEEPREAAGCLCGEVLKGKVMPADCPLFGKACTPEEPVGACMVSSEGSCAAAYKYGQSLA
ncbi:MAG: hydrogenase formation protein HypD [Syntrophotaleaceae bacterium]